ncbi:glucuronate isomerase [Verrucomicrobia bacterium]|nr:glucuronate isomerase [Verrucomicrobiota bacterium]
MNDVVSSDALPEVVSRILSQTKVKDIHTHLYDPAFGDLLLWGLDDLLVYHYLVSEAFRYFDGPYDEFFALDKSAQAERIWNALFVEHSPISEACRGVLTTLNALGLDPRKSDLATLRKWFAGQDASDYVGKCMELAGVKSICMTNSPFDDLERPVWEKGFDRDPRFESALRIDPLLLDWETSWKQLSDWGYVESADLNDSTISGIRRFLADWSTKMDSKYLMVSLPPTFRYPDDTVCVKIIEKAVLPHCKESGLPFAMMPGVKRGVNPQLQLAGDGLAKCDVASFERMFSEFPDNKFLLTALSKENQHELCVVTRKFRNLHAFGCWWFTNIPSVIEEMTRLRLELIGMSVTLQHSDARVMDQTIYKWGHTRRVVSKVLAEKYQDLSVAGWHVTEQEIARDVELLFGGSYEAFCAR